MGYALGLVSYGQIQRSSCAACWVILALSGCASPQAPSPAGPPIPADVLIRGARVFTGDVVWEGADVLVSGGKITGLGQRLPIPEGTAVLEAQGNTLLPGLIDSHTHAYLDIHLEQALAFGITTEMDMFSANPEWIAAEKERAPPNHADVFSAGILATARGGHGTQYGTEIPTVNTPSQADAFVSERIAEGSYFIKIVYDDLKTFGRDYPRMDLATLKALIDAAHRAKMLAVVHVLTVNQAREAIEAGADGLAHMFHDRVPPADLVTLAVDKGIFITDTLPLIHSLCEAERGVSLSNAPEIEKYLSPEGRENLGQTFSDRVSPPASCEAAHAAVAALHGAGVPLLASTDAPNPGTAHGASMHDELVLLVEAGLTPEEALKAATAVPADTFRLGDRGRIALGLRADLVLVRGNPFESIQATRDIVAIWKAGVPFNREAYLSRLRATESNTTSSAGGPQ